MKKFITPLLLCVPLFTMADAFVPNFKGVYGGPVAVFGKTRVGVTNQRYKKTRLMMGGLVGYGHVFEGTDWYFGHEWALISDTFSDKKATQRLEKSGQVETLFRFGEIIEHKFLPYAALGGYHGFYTVKSPTLNKKFSVSGIIGEVGVDAFWVKNVTIRSSLRYQRGFKKHRGSPAVRLQKMPQGVLLKIGLSYHLN